MNSYSASSVQFLSSLTNGLPIVAGSAALVALLLFTARYYLSPDEEGKKRVTWAKKFAQTCGAFLIIAVFMGTGFGTQVFNSFTSGKAGTNSDIANNASSSMDISGTQYELQMKKNEKHVNINDVNTLDDVGQAGHRGESTTEERERLNAQGEALGNFIAGIGENISSAAGAVYNATIGNLGNLFSFNKVDSSENSERQDWLSQTIQNKYAQLGLI